MSTYHDEVARHYDAYRPPVHEAILHEFLAGNRFACGLDIGCGTGISARALASYCDQVIGVDPSEAMLRRAVKTGSISYLPFNGRDLPFAALTFDIITFAGSLFYTERGYIGREVCRVASAGAQVLVYDFRIGLDDILKALGYSREPLSYDHEASFDGHGVSDLKRIEHRRSQYRFQVNTGELAHLILSDDHLHAFKSAGKEGDTYMQMCSALASGGFGSITDLTAETFASRYVYQG